MEHNSQYVHTVSPTFGDFWSLGPTLCPAFSLPISTGISSPPALKTFQTFKQYDIFSHLLWSRFRSSLQPVHLPKLLPLTWRGSARV